MFIDTRLLSANRSGRGNGATLLNITTLRLMTTGIATFSKMLLSITKFTITALSIMMLGKTP